MKSRSGAMTGDAFAIILRITVAHDLQKETSAEHIGIRVSRWGVAVGILILTLFIVFIARNIGEAEHFARLIEQSKPWWLILAVLLQAGTYLCAGAVWSIALRSAGHRLSVGVLARFSIEKLSVNQLMPTSGLIGNMVVLRAMRHRGIPAHLAMEALLIDVFSHYAAYATVAALTVLLLWWKQDLTRVLIVLVCMFTIVIATVPLFLSWLLRHRHWQPPSWLRRRKTVIQLLNAVAQVTPKRIGSPPLLVKTGLLQLCVFFLDSLTLWVIMLAVGVTVNPLFAFTALVVGSIASTVSFLPGGIGSFEAGCTATLTLLGTPVEAALTGTLLLRGLTLWIPLLPGFLLARREMTGHACTVLPHTS